MPHGIDRLRLWAYVAVALAGVLAGLALGRLGGVPVGTPDDGRSSPPHPRSLAP